jgi:hypothetical protein
VTVINPDPDQLQLHSPGIGPWFGAAPTPVELPLPDPGALSLTLNLGGGTVWQPPATGLHSFFIATDPRPRGLAELRAPDGGRAFEDGSFVALFRLLPWVERRLDALTTLGMTSIATPPLAGSPPRPIVRSFAMEFTSGNAPTSPTAVEAFLPSQFDWPTGVTTPEERAAHLGLTWDGSTLGNGPIPMTDLVQPGGILTPVRIYQELLVFDTDTEVKLWSFDHRGRPLDPGAVASWWAFLGNPTTGFTNLYANNVGTNVTAAATPGRVIHLTNAHEGPLDVNFTTDTDTSRLTVTNGDGTANVVQIATEATAQVTVAAANAPGPASSTPDDDPQTEVAVLPDGLYGTSATAWLGGATTILRDFCRFGVRSVERDLVGQRRNAPTGATDTQAKRAADQHRPSTRVEVHRSNPGGLQAGTQAVLGALATPPAGQATLVASVVERDAGPLTTVVPAGAIPARAPTLTVQPLDGGGAVDGNVALGQRVLVTVTFTEGPPGAFAGTWVRLWPLGFDHARGEHIRLDGGGGLVDGNDQAFIVVTLPDGTVPADGSTERLPSLGLDVMAVGIVPASGAVGQALFPDQRIDRPRPTGVETPVDIADAIPPLVVCSTGARVAGAVPLVGVEPGSEVVALGQDPPALIDRSTIAAVAFVANSVGNLLGAGDTIELTAPAFRTQLAEPLATGDDPALLAQGGATVVEQDRQLLQAPGGAWSAGFPYPGMERTEVVLADLGGGPNGNGAAVVGSTPLLGPLHALPQNRQGSPFSPGGPSVQGHGVLTTGSGAIPMAEYVRDRITRSTGTLITSAAGNPIVDPQTPAGPSLWVAGLRTEAKGVAAEIGLGALADLLTYPFDGTFDDVLNALSGLLTGLPTSMDDSAIDARRALDRRINIAANGAREGATAMVAAIRRAEDFIWIETPAIDHLTFGSTDTDDPDSVSLWQSLVDRMDANPALHVAACLPVGLLPGAPEPLQRARDLAVSEALTAMLSDAGGTTRAERFVAFSPAAGPARSLRLAGTTMVVDDAVAFVGTTHLWRRGLSYDSSYAVAVLDEQQLRGRSAEVLNFRFASMAAAIDVTPNQLPLDPSDTIRAIGALAELGGFQRLAPDHIRRPDPALTPGDTDLGLTELDIWDPDGSFPGASDVAAWLLTLQTAVADDVFNPGQP